MADFKPVRIWDAVYPEAFGVLAYLGAKRAASYVKERQALTGWKNPEYYVDGSALVLPLALIGMDKVPEESKALFYAATGVVGEKLARKAYDATIGKKAKKIGSGKIRNKGGKGDVLAEAERARQIAAQQQNAMAIANQRGAPVSIGSYTQI